MKSRARLNLNTGEAMIPVNSGDCNSWRLEQYLSDCIELSDKVVGLQMPRTEFAWLKKSKGPCSPQSVCLAMSLLHQSWIRQAGGTFCGNKTASDRDDAKCEISPLVSYDGEDLDGQFWLPIELPFYLPSQQEDAESTAAQLTHPNQGSIHFLNWESDFAKQNLDQELQFALNKVFDTTSLGQGYRGEKAESSENLSPTPDHDIELQEELERRIQENSPAKKKTITNQQGFQEHDETVADWILGPRVKQTASEALVGSPRMTAKRKDGAASSRKSGRLGSSRLSSSARMSVSARGNAGSGRSSIRRSFRSDSPRANLLSSGMLPRGLSFRCVPPHTQGLEISEYGRRQGAPEHTSQWWYGEPREDMRPPVPIEVPSGLNCAIS